jgi:hypothetical protein
VTVFSIKDRKFLDKLNALASQGAVRLLICHKLFTGNLNETCNCERTFCYTQYYRFNCCF